MKKHTSIPTYDINYLFRYMKDGNSIGFDITEEGHTEPNDIMIAFTDTLVKIQMNEIIINGECYLITRESLLFSEIFKNMIEFIIRNLDINVYSKLRADYREYDRTNTMIKMVNCNCKLVHLTFIKMIQSKLIKKDTDILKIYLEVLNKRLDEYNYDFDIDWRI